MEAKTIYLIVFFIFLLANFAITYWTKRGQKKDGKGYFLGNRDIGPWPIAFSFAATLQSASLFMGSGGDMYRRGLAFSVFGTMMLTVGIVLTWVFMAKPLTRLTTKLNVITLPEMFDYRFNSRKIKLVSAIGLCIFYVPMMGSQLVAAGKLFESLIGWPFWAGIVVIGAVLIIITALGGFKGVVYTDFFQGIIMYGVFFLLVPIMLGKVGGLTAMNQRLMTEMPQILSIAGNKNYFTPLMAISWCVYFLFGLNFAQPSILVRYIGTKDREVIKRAFPLTITCHAFSLICMTIVMLATNILIPGIKDKEIVFPTIMQQYMPPIIAGLCLCAVFSAMVSTVDSLLLVASSAFSEDIFKGWLKRDASEKTGRTMGVIASVVLGLAAVVVALNSGADSILKLNVYAGSAVIPLFLFPVFGVTMFKRLNEKGCLAGMIAGIITAIVWELTVGWKFCVPALPIIAVTTVVTLVVTYTTKKPPVEVTDVFFGDASRASLDAYRKQQGVLEAINHGAENEG